MGPMGILLEYRSFPYSIYLKGDYRVRSLGSKGFGLKPWDGELGLRV